MHRPVLYLSQILAWVDAYQDKTGQWPKKNSGLIDGPLDLSWRKVDNALVYGLEKRSKRLAWKML